MSRKMTLSLILSLILATVLAISACSKKSTQVSQSPQPENPSSQASPAQQMPNSDQAAPATAPPPAETASAKPNPPRSARPPVSKWHDAQQPSPQTSKAKAPESSWSDAAPAPQPIVLPTGTHITIRLSESLDAKKNKAGDSFEGTVAQPVVLDGKNVIPAASPVTGSVVEAAAPGKLKGEGRLAIKLTQIKVQGVLYPISTSTFAQTLHGKGKRSAVMIGGGSGAGALVGGLVGGGKGAAIGAAVGGGAGTAGATMTGNEQLALTAEAALTFNLQQPLKLTGTSATPKPKGAPPASQ